MKKTMNFYYLLALSLATNSTSYKIMINYINNLTYEKLKHLITYSLCLKLILLILYIILISLGINNTISSYIVSFIIPILITVRLFLSKNKKEDLITLSLNMSIANLFWFLVSLFLDTTFINIFISNLNSASNDFDLTEKINSEGLNKVLHDKKGLPTHIYSPWKIDLSSFSNLPNWDEIPYQTPAIYLGDVPSVKDLLNELADQENLKNYRAKIDKYNSEYIPTGPSKFLEEKKNPSCSWF